MNTIKFYDHPEIIKSGETNAHFLPDLKNEKGKHYVPSDALKQAVEIALMLKKPLLVTGPPGTGKSELAYHLAYHFGLGDVLFFGTRTDSSATDLLYRYDSIAHFHKVNIEKNKELTAEKIEKEYIHYQALGEAICNSNNVFHEKIEPKNRSRRRVVLIDEIDKAPRDLPNDILTIIEDMKFEVPELKTASHTSEKIWKKEGDSNFSPIVILTSNSEKTLPEAFLRRCVFFHIDFPDDKELRKILRKKESLFPDFDKNEDEYTKLVDVFLKISKDVAVQKPSTHELILWAWWMNKNGFLADDIYAYKNLSESKKTKLLSGVSILTKETTDWKNISEKISTGTLPK